MGRKRIARTRRGPRKWKMRPLDAFVENYRQHHAPKDIDETRAIKEGRDG